MSVALDLPALQRVVEAVPDDARKPWEVCGPWPTVSVYVVNPGALGDEADEGRCIAIVGKTTRENVEDDPLATFIATFNPETVGALLGEVERLRRVEAMSTLTPTSAALVAALEDVARLAKAVELLPDEDLSDADVRANKAWLATARNLDWDALLAHVREVTRERDEALADVEARKLVEAELRSFIGRAAQRVVKLSGEKRTLEADAGRLRAIEAAARDLVWQPIGSSPEEEAERKRRWEAARDALDAPTTGTARATKGEEKTHDG